MLMMTVVEGLLHEREQDSREQEMLRTDRRPRVLSQGEPSGLRAALHPTLGI